MEEERSRFRSRAGALTLVLLVLCAIGVAFGANVWKRGLKVQEVRTQGNRIVTSNDLIALADIKKSQKLFDVDLLAARRRVQTNQFIRSASVNRDIPDRITITVDERSPVAALAGTKLMYLDQDGYVLPPTRSEFIYDLPVVTGDLQQADCVPGRQITGTNLKEALALLNAAKAIGDEFYREISEVHVEGEKNLILYTADAGVPVLVGRGDIPRKLLKFQGFWNEIVRRRGTQELEYADLRFDDQVVVRWKQGTQ